MLKSKHVLNFFVNMLYLVFLFHKYVAIINISFFINILQYKYFLRPFFLIILQYLLCLFLNNFLNFEYVRLLYIYITMCKLNALHVVQQLELKRRHPSDSDSIRGFVVISLISRDHVSNPLPLREEDDILNVPQPDLPDGYNWLQSIWH